MMNAPYITFLRRFDLNALVILQVLLRTSSVAATAQLLSVSPSAVSKVLSQLRRDFGDQLLVRTSNRMFLTERAKEVRAELDEILGRFTHLYSGGGGDTPATQSRSVVLGANDYIQATLGVTLLAFLNKSTPPVKMHMRPVARQVAQLLADGVLDLIVGTENLESRGLRSTLLGRERFACVIGKESRWSKELERPLTLGTFCDLPQVDVTPSGTGYMAELVERQLLRDGRRRHVELTCSSYLALPALLDQLDAICMLPERILQVPSMAAGVRRLELAFQPPEYDLYMYWHNITHRDQFFSWFRSNVVALYSS